MKVLVIGGTGVVSGGVVRELLSRGADVTIFHRGTTTAAHVASKSVKEIIGDRSDHEGFVKTMRARDPWDCVIEVIGGVPADADSHVAAFGGRVPHLIFCSTCTVYGRPFKTIPPKEDAYYAPPSPYGVNKLATEQKLREAEAAGHFAVTIIRPSHTYGEKSLTIHSLGNRTSHLDRLIHGRPIIVHDDGQTLWSSSWTDDVGSAFAASALESPQSRGRTYHLGGSQWVTWDDYHRALATALGAPPPEILHVPTDTLARLLPERTLQCQRSLRYGGIYDYSAATQDLGYRPKVMIAEGFARNVNYLRASGLIEPWENDTEYEELAAKVASGAVI